MSTSTAYHNTFTLERTFSAPPSKVYSAFTDPQAKQRWFQPPPGWVGSGYRFDPQVGGTEHMESTPPGDKPHIFDAVYHELLPDRRVIFSYTMHHGEERLSVSLTTIELTPVDGGTHLSFTEQGAFLDADAQQSATMRVQGTEQLLDAIERAVSAEPAGV